MRGYSDLATLVITVVSEWPALVAGVFASTAFVQFCLGKWPNHLRTLFPAVGVAVLACSAAYFAQADIEAIISRLLPYIPGEWMHNLGTFHFWQRTCGRAKSDCLAEADNAILVMATVAKGGAMLAAKLIFEVSVYCGLCLSGGSREGPGTPGEQERPPTFEGDALLAIVNMRGWPAYVRKLHRRHRCVAFARDPEERLRSYYLYARSGGEYWVRSAGIMRRLEVPNTTASLDDFWEFSGRGYLQQSHEYLLTNQGHGCTMIPYRALKSAFNTTILTMLDAWGIRKIHHKNILVQIQKYDFGRWSKEALANDPHHSSSKFSSSLVNEVTDWLRKHSEIQRIISKHRSEIDF